LRRRQFTEDGNVEISGRDFTALGEAGSRLRDYWVKLSPFQRYPRWLGSTIRRL
jgi:hypothetical protein